MSVARLLYAVGALLIASQILRTLAIKVGQPPVLGEIVAGLALGPSLLGAIWPSFQHSLFPSEMMPELSALATIGATLFMLDVGLNLDVPLLRRQGWRVAFLGGWNVVVPFVAGCLLGVALWPAYHGRHATLLAFVLFMGVAMSITAFPVLAKIINETGLTRSALATQALAIAAMGDVAAWVMLAAASAAAKGGSPWHAALVLAELLAITIAWVVVGRLVVSRVSVGLGPLLGIALLLGGLTDAIGAHAIFGGFIAGVVVPRHQAAALSARLSTVVETLLLPVFFVVAGLQTHLGSVHSSRDIAVLFACLAVAILGKLGSVTVATRVTGSGWRESAAMGALMNTRGLTELVVLVVGLNLGVLTPALFAMLVVVALVTTAMTRPLLAVLGYAPRHGVVPRQRETSELIVAAESAPAAAP
jgi:Kef-type K+ transport system membrane component KefB